MIEWERAREQGGGGERERDSTWSENVCVSVCVCGGGGGAQDKLNPATAGIRTLLQADSYNPAQPIDLSKVER